MSAYYTSVGSVNIRNVTMFLGIIRGKLRRGYHCNSSSMAKYIVKIYQMM